MFFVLARIDDVAASISRSRVLARLVIRTIPRTVETAITISVPKIKANAVDMGNTRCLCGAAFCPDASILSLTIQCKLSV